MSMKLMSLKGKKTISIFSISRHLLMTFSVELQLQLLKYYKKRKFQQQNEFYVAHHASNERRSNAVISCCAYRRYFRFAENSIKAWLKVFHEEKLFTRSLYSRYFCCSIEKRKKVEWDDKQIFAEEEKRIFLLCYDDNHNRVVVVVVISLHSVQILAWIQWKFLILENVLLFFGVDTKSQ